MPFGVKIKDHFYVNYIQFQTSHHFIIDRIIPFLIQNANLHW